MDSADSTLPQWSTRPRRRGPGTTVCRVAQPHRIPGEVRPRRRLPGARHQRGRRVHHRTGRDRTAASATAFIGASHGMMTRGGGGPERHRRTHRGTLVRARRDAHRIGRGRTPGHALLRSRRTGLGAVLTVTPESKPYAEFRTDEELLACYERRATAAGRRFSSGPDAMMARASTDMGNVSQTLPAIHPLHRHRLTAGGQPPTRIRCRHHHRRSRNRHRTGCAALAGTVVDAASQPDIRRRLLTGV